jgi:hypothetical protein
LGRGHLHKSRIISSSGTTLGSYKIMKFLCATRINIPLFLNSFYFIAARPKIIDIIIIGACCDLPALVDQLLGFFSRISENKVAQIHRPEAAPVVHT